MTIYLGLNLWNGIFFYKKYGNFYYYCYYKDKIASSSSFFVWLRGIKGSYEKKESFYLLRNARGAYIYIKLREMLTSTLKALVNNLLK